MQFLILVLAVCLVIFLFTLYFLTHDDLLIVRKGIAMETIFNTAFLTIFVSLFFARLFYVLIYPKQVFFSILGFFLFSYFPGLSLLGGVLAGTLFLLFIANYKKLPVAKFFDFFAVALVSSLPIGFLGGLILLRRLDPTFLFSFFSFLVIAAVFIKWVFPISFRGDLRDGSLGLLFLISFSIIWFLARIIVSPLSLSILNIENIILILFFITSLVFVFKKEVYKKPRVKR